MLKRVDITICVAERVSWVLTWGQVVGVDEVVFREFGNIFACRLHQSQVPSQAAATTETQGDSTQMLSCMLCRYAIQAYKTTSIRVRSVNEDDDEETKDDAGRRRTARR